METVIFVWTICKAALGLGFVIFIHELGHFLLAKWNGVKVEKFSIGFGPTLASYRRGVGLRIGTGSRPPGPGDPPTWGETEYILAGLPLGGYVKMLGENNEESVDDEKPSIDPRAYHNKSVWARMQIITAGVIMNVILAVACFTFVYTQGMTDLPAKVGGILPASPSYKAGLQAGDEIVAIDGRRDVGFRDLMGRVNMSGAGQKIKFTIRRAGAKDEQTFEIEPLREGSNAVPTIGVLAAQSLELRPKPPSQTPEGTEAGKAKPSASSEEIDKVVAVGPEGGPLEPVEDQVDYIKKIEKLRDLPLVLEVERKKSETDESPTRARLTIASQPFLDFGLGLTPGPIAAIRPDSPAEKAGLKEGDKIIAVDGHADFDPMRLPDLARDSADKPMTLTVERPEAGKPPTTIEMKVTPDASPTWVDPFDDDRLVPLGVPGLGLALAIEPKIRTLAEDSPASKAGLKVGDTLRSMILTPPKGEDGKAKPKPVTITLDGKVGGWPVAYLAAHELPWASIELTTDKSVKPIKITPKIDQKRSNPMRSLAFFPLLRKLPPLGMTDAFGRGWEEMIDSVFNTFRLFRGMFQSRISHDAVGGVIPIARIAYSAASAGWTTFIHILGMLSITLAVLNFLPIPPLDGGQFMILSAEKVRGKPLPDPVVNFLTIAGLVFVLALIVLVNGRDIFKLVQSYF